jgi:hypothetical protein
VAAALCRRTADLSFELIGLLCVACVNSAQEEKSVS